MRTEVGNYRQTLAGVCRCCESFDTTTLRDTPPETASSLLGDSDAATVRSCSDTLRLATRLRDCSSSSPCRLQCTTRSFTTSVTLARRRALYGSNDRITDVWFPRQPPHEGAPSLTDIAPFGGHRAGRQDWALPICSGVVEATPLPPLELDVAQLPHQNTSSCNSSRRVSFRSVCCVCSVRFP